MNDGVNRWEVGLGGGGRSLTMLLVVMVVMVGPPTAPSRAPLRGQGPSPLLRTPCLHPGPLALGPSYLSISMPAHRCPSTASVGMGAPPSSPPPQQSQHTRGSLGAERWTEALRLHVSGQILPPTARGCPCVLWKHSWGRCPPAWSDRPLTTPLGPKKTVLPRPGRDSPKLQTPGEPQGAREPTSETGAGGWPQI